MEGEWFEITTFVTIFGLDGLHCHRTEPFFIRSDIVPVVVQSPARYSVTNWTSCKRQAGAYPIHMTKCHSIRHQTPKIPTPPQKVMQQFFLGYSGPYFGPTNTNHTKNYQKITFWALFRIPPQNALQCTTVQCNVLKCKRLNYSLQMGQI